MNKNSMTHSLNCTACLSAFYFLKEQSATREHLSDSFGTGNAFLLVLFKSLTGTVPIIPEEYIRYLTLSKSRVFRVVQPGSLN